MHHGITPRQRSVLALAAALLLFSAMQGGSAASKRRTVPAPPPPLCQEAIVGCLTCAAAPLSYDGAPCINPSGRKLQQLDLKQLLMAVAARAKPAASPALTRAAVPLPTKSSTTSKTPAATTTTTTKKPTPSSSSSGAARRPSPSPKPAKRTPSPAPAKRQPSPAPTKARATPSPPPAKVPLPVRKTSPSPSPSPAPVPKPAVQVSAAANILALGKAVANTGASSSSSSGSSTLRYWNQAPAGKKVYVPSGCGKQGQMCIDCASDVGYVLNAYGTCDCAPGYGELGGFCVQCSQFEGTFSPGGPLGWVQCWPCPRDGNTQLVPNQDASACVSPGGPPSSPSPSPGPSPPPDVPPPVGDSCAAPTTASAVVAIARRDTVTIALTFPLTGEAQTASLGRPTSSAARPRTAPLRSVPRRPARTARSTSSRVVASAIAAGRSPTGYSAQSFDFGLDGLSSLAGDQAPLDPAMAARTVTAGDGGYQMVTAVNSQFEVTNLDSGYFELGSSGAQPLSNFGQGLPFAGSYSYRSPGVFWDLDQQRWVLVLTAAVPDGDTSDPPAFILLAVSQTDDAIGSWWVYALPAAGGLAACPGSAYAAPDYTQATYDVNGIYITTQITCNGVASQSAILAVPKAAAYDGSLARYAVYSSAAMVAALPAAQKSALAPTAAAAFAPWPALPQAKEDVGALAYFVTQAALNVTTGTLGLTNPWVFTSALTNTQRLRSLTSATSSTPTLLSVLWDKGYPTQQQDVPMPQPAFEDGTASVPLQVEDQNLRVTGAALSAGVLTVVKTEVNTGTTAAPLSPVNSVYWARLNPGTGTSFLCVDGTPGGFQRAARGNVASDQALHLAYPSVAVEPSGDALIGFTYSAAGTLPDPGDATAAPVPSYPGMAYAYLAPNGTTGPVLILRAGQDAVNTVLTDSGAGAYGRYTTATNVNGFVWLAGPYGVVPSTPTGQYNAGMWVNFEIDPAADSADPLIPAPSGASAPAAGAGGSGAPVGPQEDLLGVEVDLVGPSGDPGAWDIAAP